MSKKEREEVPEDFVAKASPPREENPEVEAHKKKSGRELTEEFRAEAQKLHDTHQGPHWAFIVKRLDEILSR